MYTSCGTSLAVQWLGLCLPMQAVRVRFLVGELGSHMRWGQKKTQNIKRRQCCNKFNKDFENGPHQKKKIVYKLVKKHFFGNI